MFKYLFKFVIKILTMMIFALAVFMVSCDSASNSDDDDYDSISSTVEIGAFPTFFQNITTSQVKAISVPICDMGTIENYYITGYGPKNIEGNDFTTYKFDTSLAGDVKISVYGPYFDINTGAEKSDSFGKKVPINDNVVVLQRRGIYKLKVRCPSKPKPTLALSVTCTQTCGRQTLTPGELLVLMSKDKFLSFFENHINAFISNGVLKNLLITKIKNLVESSFKEIDDPQKTRKIILQEIQAREEEWMGKNITNNENLPEDVKKLKNKLSDFDKNLVEILKIAPADLSTTRYLFLAAETWGMGKSKNDQIDYNTINFARDKVTDHFTAKLKEADISPVGRVRYISAIYTNRSNDNEKVIPKIGEPLYTSDGKINVGTKNTEGNLEIRASGHLDYSMTNEQLAGGIYLAQILNGLLENENPELKPKGSNPCPVSMEDNVDKKTGLNEKYCFRMNVNEDDLPIETMGSLFDALIATGHRLELWKVTTYANFLGFQADINDLDFHNDLILPTWLDTGIQVKDKTNKTNKTTNFAVPMAHSEYELNVTGPTVKGRVAFFLGTGGVGFWPVTGVRPEWSGNRVVEQYTCSLRRNSDCPVFKVFSSATQTFYNMIKKEINLVYGDKAVELVGEQIKKIANMLNANNNPELALELNKLNSLIPGLDKVLTQKTSLNFDGYGTLGVCNDSVAHVSYEIAKFLRPNEAFYPEFPLLRSSANFVSLFNEDYQKELNNKQFTKDLDKFYDARSDFSDETWKASLCKRVLAMKPTPEVQQMLIGPDSDYKYQQLEGSSCTVNEVKSNFEGLMKEIKSEDITKYLEEINAKLKKVEKP